MSQLLNYLPGIYQEDVFLKELLAPFEQVLLGGEALSHTKVKGIEETIERVTEYINPRTAPEHFLPWLEKCVALSFQDDVGVEKKREVIAKIIPFYQLRGTKKNLEELLQLFIDCTAKVEEPDACEFQIGEHSTLGVDTYIGGPPPFRFHVDVVLQSRECHEFDERDRFVAQQERLAKAVIEIEKPAHTQYTVAVHADHVTVVPKTLNKNDESISTDME